MSDAITIAQTERGEYHEPIDDRKIMRSIWSMGYPSMIGFAATNLYTVADMFWVSRVGADAVAAITIFAAFYWVIGSVNQIAGVGSVAVISRRFGERDFPRTETAIVEAFALKTILALVFGTIGFFFTPAIVRLLGADGAVYDYAVGYGRIMMLGLVFNFNTYTLFTALRSINHPRWAMMIMVGSTIFNATLDPFLIFGWWGMPALGVKGAAVASVIGYMLTISFGLTLFFRGAFRLRLSMDSIRRMHSSTQWQMLKIGMPSGVSSVSYSLGRLVVTPMIAHFGNPAIAIYGAGNRVVELAVMLVVGLELGMSPLVGHALGAGDKLRAWVVAKKSVILAVLMMSALGVVMFFAARPVTAIFFEGAPYDALGLVFFRVCAVAFPFIGLFIILEGAFGGAGDTVPTMVVGVIHAWVLEIPLVWLFAYNFDFGPTGVWWGQVIAIAGAGLMLLYWFSRKRWLERVV